MLGEDNRYKVLLIVLSISLFVILILVGVFYLSGGSSVAPGQGVEGEPSEENPLPDGDDLDKDPEDGAETEEDSP